jgi:hypothetical protein
MAAQIFHSMTGSSIRRNTRVRYCALRGLDFSMTVPVDPMTGAWPAPGEGPIEVPCTAPCTGASVTASSGDGQAMLSSYIQVIAQNQPNQTPADIPSLSLDEKNEVFRFKAPPSVSQPPKSK